MWTELCLLRIILESAECVDEGQQAVGHAIYIHTHTRIHMHIHICVCIYVKMPPDFAFKFLPDAEDCRVEGCYSSVNSIQESGT